MQPQSISINIINHSDNPLPAYATSGSSGMDIRAFLEADIALQPMERTLVPTGLFIELEAGYEVQIRPRSGLAIKQGITCLNTPGTIDADYRGEIGVLLINLSNEDVIIESGERVAQMVVAPFVQAQLTETNALSETSRGEGGFGSTGKN